MPRPSARIDLAAVADAFAAGGLRGTSAAAVAAAAGVAKPTLYAHGTSKETLFLRAVEAEVERVAGLVEAALAGAAGRPARDRATAAARAVLDHAALRPHGARLLWRTAAHDGSPVAEAVDLALRRVPDRLASALRRDLAADGLDPGPAAVYARAAHGAAIALAHVRPGEARPARATLAALAAACVPAPAPREADWPAV